MFICSSFSAFFSIQNSSHWSCGRSKNQEQLCMITHKYFKLFSRKTTLLARELLVFQVCNFKIIDYLCKVKTLINYRLKSLVVYYRIFLFNNNKLCFIWNKMFTVFCSDFKIIFLIQIFLLKYRIYFRINLFQPFPEFVEITTKKDIRWNN